MPETPDPRKAVLQSVYREQPVTRRTLSLQTGLGAARLGTLVSQLIADGLLGEQPSQEGVPGRPAGALFINPDAGRSLGLEIEGSRWLATLTDLAGRVLYATAWPNEPVPQRAVILDRIVELIGAACGVAGLRPRELAALGIGLGAIVDARSGRVLGWPNTPAWAAAWQGLELRAELAARLGIPAIVVEDSVLAMGVNAARQGPAQDKGDFLYVYLGDGIGSQLFIDGRPYRSATGLTGELGHIPLQEDGPWCSCGNRGCLEVLASGQAVLNRMAERLSQARPASPLRQPFERGQLTLDMVLDAAQDGDKIAYQILDETGGYIGKVLAVALNLLGPNLVVLGGPLMRGNGVVLAAVQRQVRLTTLQYIASQTRIVCDDQGESAGARGAAHLAIEAVFASPDKWLSGKLGCA